MNVPAFVQQIFDDSESKPIRKICTNMWTPKHHGFLLVSAGHVLRRNMYGSNILLA
jgi:hypothetical protein